MMGDFVGWLVDEWPGRIIAALFLALFLLMGIAFCAEWDKLSLHEGDVVAKEYSPAHNTTVWVPMGKILFPQTRHHPEAWSVTIQGVDGRGRTNKRTVNVSRDVFDRARVGQRLKVEP